MDNYNTYGPSPRTDDINVTPHISTHLLLMDEQKTDDITTKTHTPPPTPPTRSSGIFKKMLITMLAIAIGGAFLGLGLGAGYIATRHFMDSRTTPAIEMPQDMQINTIQLESPVVSIDPRTPDFTDVIAQVKDSVVSINVTSAPRQGGGIFGGIPENHGAGSGFFFAQDEEYVFVATNHHVIAGAATITVSIDDDTRIPARIIGSAPDYDLAVLAVTKVDLEEKGVPFVLATLGCSDTMRMGDSVVAIGNAMGAGQTVTKGIISAVDMQITVHDPSTNAVLTLDVMQTDAAVNQGNSGGPLINQYGEVVGIVTAKLFGHGIEGMGYVLPVSNIEHMLADMQETGSIRIPFMGIQHYDVDEALRDMFNLPSVGVLIRSVSEGAPAYIAGLMERDIIVRFDGEVVYGQQQFIDLLLARRPGDTVTIGVYRNNEYMEVELTLGSATPAM